MSDNDNFCDDEYEEKNEFTDFELKKNLFEKRIVIMSKEITEDSVAELRGDLISLSLKSTDPITLYINSVGGEVDPALSLYDLITNNLRAPVNGIVGPRCFSSALIVLQACKKRCALPNSKFFVHPCEAEISFKSNIIVKKKVTEINKLLSSLQERFNRILSKRSNLSLGQINKLSQQSNGEGALFYSEVAKKYGFIDSIMKGEEKYKIF